jgi:hypothetical protein
VLGVNSGFQWATDFLDCPSTPLPIYDVFCRRIVRMQTSTLKGFLRVQNLGTSQDGKMCLGVQLVHNEQTGVVLAEYGDFVVPRGCEFRFGPVSLEFTLEVGRPDDAGGIVPVG